MSNHPTVTAFSVTPVKGFALHHPQHIDLDHAGVAGNREFFLVDARHRLLSITRNGAFASWTARFDASDQTLAFAGPDDECLSGPVEAGKPLLANFFGERDVACHLVDGPWAARFTELAGEAVRLARVDEPGSGCDVHPVTLLADESVAAVGAHGGLPDFDRRRFRMLIGLTGIEPFAEESWQGRQVRAGTALLRIGGPVPRCAATTRNPDTGITDAKTLHLINQLRGRTPNESGDGLNLGVYATVETPGRVSLGDTIVVS